jgi:uncharacterized protein (TIGR03435 family)
MNLAINLLACCAAASCLLAQTEFDVATVKPSPTEFRGIILGEDGSFRAGGTTLKTLVSSVYDVPEFRIDGGSGWVDTDRWDIEARVSAAQKMTGAAFQLLLRALLEERFHLRATKELKEGDVYFLDLAKSGAKMRPSPDGARPEIRERAGVIASQKLTTELLAATLGRLLHRIVIDRTGLTAAYDVRITWTPEAGEGDPLRSGAALPPGGLEQRSIFAALEEDLGVKLTSGRAQVPSVTILSVERPGAN